MASVDKKGKLILIPTPLGETMNDIFSTHTKHFIKSILVFVCEKGKTARHFLKTLDLDNPLQEMTFLELNKRTPKTDLPNLLQAALEGQDIGLLSEAGCPGVADPGADLVRLAHQEGIQVVPLIGPSSLLLALMASGMNGQSFAFVGYLPIKSNERNKRFKQLEKIARQNRQTQLFIETPYRNNALVQDALSTLSSDTLFCVACDLTLESEFVQTKTIKKWNSDKNTLPDLHKRPTVFLIQA